MDTLRVRIDIMIDVRHELSRLGKLVDLGLLEEVFAAHLCGAVGMSGEAGVADGGFAVPKAHVRAVGPGAGGPQCSATIWIVAVRGWGENPFWQCSCGRV